jgi:hypothetical protein
MAFSNILRFSLSLPCFGDISMHYFRDCDTDLAITYLSVSATYHFQRARLIPRLCKLSSHHASKSTLQLQILFLDFPNNFAKLTQCNSPVLLLLLASIHMSFSGTSYKFPVPPPPRVLRARPFHTYSLNRPKRRNETHCGASTANVSINTHKIRKRKHFQEFSNFEWPQHGGTTDKCQHSLSIYFNTRQKKYV